MLQNRFRRLEDCLKVISQCVFIVSDCDRKPQQTPVAKLRNIAGIIEQNQQINAIGIEI